MQIKTLLRKYREYKCMTQKELATFLGVAPNTIARSEAGTRANGMGHINKILKAEGWTLKELLLKFEVEE